MTLAVLRGVQDKNNVTISYVPYTVGRCRSADFVIAHVNVSRNHCKIVQENKSWKIDDFSSSGTYINDALVGKGKSHVLNDGDSIRFGPKENNLCWTFYSHNASSETCSRSEAKPKIQVVLNPNNGQCTLREENSADKLTNLAPEEDSRNEGSTIGKNYLKSTTDGDLKVCQQKIDTNNLKLAKGQKNIKEYLHPAKEEVVQKKSECQKIEQEKNLQEKQSALNHLEEKNNAFQVQLHAGPSNKTDLCLSTNLLENLADFMETEFQCTICSELFVTAVTLNCTHTFCKYCINQWKKKQKTCPICRKKITNETRSLVVDNYIDKVVGNLSVELKERRETIIKERNQPEPCKKKAKTSKKHS